MSLDPDRARQLRRRRMHERQAVVFGVLLAGLAVVGLGAAALYTDSVDLPFLDKQFAAEPTPTPTFGNFPCPPEGAKPVKYSKVKVNVYNGTSTAGLAGRTGDEVKDRGFKVLVVTNAPVQYQGVARINFGIKGVAAAYTLLAHIPGAELKQDARKDASVDLTLGSDFQDLQSLDEVALDPDKPLVAPADCKPLEEIAAQASAKATPKASAKATAKK
ncbi:LytR C-terminal domain-containing protein [Cellulomonas edaphi]|uniref:LytR C-terminal domain-containing protein n=1 Tax=Cellulomonas edaphi TaxID=3053468 RepID=A0ABT7S2H6_9CELL|nr:LytR C-terminal domain-containing protein [Cellulomons edaphi]MDM7829820.1 LytR C-terminal domain-containing protein [Cellulomons edaphi]